MSIERNEMINSVEEAKLPRRLFGLAAPEITNSLVAIILVLLLHAVGNLLSALFSLTNQNLQGFLVYLAIAAIYGVPAYGLLNFNKWARIFQLVSSLFMVITGFISIFGGNRLIGAVAVVMHGLIAMYLLSEGCQRLFRTASLKSKSETVA